MKIRTWCNRLLGAAALGGTVYFCVVAASPSSSLAQRSTAETEVAEAEVDSAELMGALLRAGISPEALAVSGVSVEDVPGIFSRANEHMREASWALSAADSLCRSRDAEVRRIEQLRRSGRAEEGDRQALEQASLLAAEAAVARTTVLDSIFHSAIDGLPEQSTRLLGVIRRNEGLLNDPELMVVERSPAEWQSIREALATNRGAQRQATPREVQDFLTRIRADAEVVAARERLGSLEPIRQAWRQAIEGR